MTAALEPDGVTIQQSQNRLKVAGQDGLIDIQTSGFGIGVESLDRAQMRRSSIVSAVPDEHEVHGPLREWTPEAGLSNQWLGQLMNIYYMTCRLT
ncbi:hypothetical protein V2I68_11505 [Pseudomonas viridiflava]|uniref:Uncharacterized protein n=1 Tax=Pseudomonas viridiflava TaxID=33069 RepID=A0ABU7N947_PSEVI|nr:hypothetical protein [Pseudomonas viridiflava]MEE4041471.1 hypothetical protein [Pseudomonas viridiflava]MEE4059341.1 hypothetical protein [Pseudomonas viridiflava]MEE4168209.1 hypothetical protein [Pseudomonas viridiflava]